MLRHRIAAAAAGLGLALAPPLAVAQKAPVDDTLPLEGSRQRAEGEYGGVSPGQPPRDDGNKPKKRPRNGTLSWVGFVTEAGGGRLFIQAPTEFGYTQELEGKVLTVHLDGIKSLARNVRRPLDTRFFDSTVARVTVKKVSARRARKGKPARKSGAVVRIQFKNAADAAVAAARTTTESDGYFYLYLDFGAAPSAQPAADPQPE